MTPRIHRFLERIRALGVLTALIAVMGPAYAVKEPHRFYGYAFDEVTGKYLYTEVHQHWYDGDRWLSGSVRYFSADNRLLGEKILDFSKDPYIPIFHMKFPLERYEEGISHLTPSKVDLEMLSEGKRDKSQLERRPGMVADAGFHSFIVDHLDELQMGKILEFPFVVAGRLTSYQFRIKKIGEGVQEGHPVIKLQAEPDSLLRFLVSPLLLSYDLQTRYLVEYRGISNLHDPVTNKSYPAVHIVFPSKPPLGAPSVLPAFDSGSGIVSAIPDKN